MRHFIALLFLALPALAEAHGGPELVVAERVDVACLNHFYDEQGRLVFDQVIFFDWDRNAERHQVRAWRLVKNPAQIPLPDWEQGGFAATWNDGEVLRTVRAGSMYETFTQYDPELIEREWLPKERRKELRTIKVDKPSGVIRP